MHYVLLFTFCQELDLIKTAWLLLLIMHNISFNLYKKVYLYGYKNILLLDKMTRQEHQKFCLTLAEALAKLRRATSCNYMQYIELVFRSYCRYISKLSLKN